MQDKQMYVIEARKLINSYRRRLDQLRVEALQAEGDTRMQYHGRIGELQSHLQALLAGVEELENSRGESWLTLRRSVDNASRQFGDRLDLTPAG